MSLSFFKQHRGSLKQIIHFTSAEVLCVLSPSTCIHHKTCWRSSHVSCFYHLGLWWFIFPFKPSNCSVIVILLQSMHWEMQFCSIKWHCIVWWTTLKYNYIYIKHTCCQCSAIQVKLNSVVLQISTTTGLMDSCTATWTKLQFLCNSCSALTWIQLQFSYFTVYSWKPFHSSNLTYTVALLIQSLLLL